MQWVTSRAPDGGGRLPASPVQRLHSTSQDAAGGDSPGPGKVMEGWAWPWLLRGGRAGGQGQALNIYLEDGPPPPPHSLERAFGDCINDISERDTWLP